jgi:hypothetical protein
MPAPHALPSLEGRVSLTAVGAHNLRALRMQDPVELRRLLLIVGRNGIGKSTLARLFPLLRQSSGNRAREPILWWEDGQVDYGSFAEALRRGATEMVFSFRFEEGGQPWGVAATLVATADGCRVARVRFEEASCSLELHFERDGALSRSTAVSTPGEPAEDALQVTPEMRTDPWRLFGVPREPEDPTALLQHAERLFHGNTDVPRRRGILMAIPWDSDQGVMSALKPHRLGQWYQRAVAQLGSSPREIHKLRLARFVWHGVERLRQAETLVEEAAARTAYIGPFRAVPQRSYRPAPVAVEQLDPRGDNLAMFVAALTPAERESLNQFLSASLDLQLHLGRDGGRYQLLVILNHRTYNLVDVGFGYSQVLPVATQIWAASRVLEASRAPVPLATVVAEQPELHLHPHHQMLIARIFAQSAMADSGPVQIIETHSDHLVIELGRLIARGRLAPERVGVLCVEPDPPGATDSATVRMATYNEDGVLQGWPAGFLAP